MKSFMLNTLCYFMISFCCLCSLQGTESRSHGMAIYGDLKYQKDFRNFDYVKADAPKGGKIKFGVTGTFNTLNPFVVKGSSPPGLSFYTETLVFEKLMQRSADEPFSLYGLIAESVSMASDRSSITFYLNPQARWADGHPVTAEDVIFSFETLKEKGQPNLQLYYSRVLKVEKISNLSVRFIFKPLPEGDYDREAPFIIALMTIMPSHYLLGKDIEKIGLEPIVGSGPYKIISVRPGHSIHYQRRDDYWGINLPVNQGRFNFDEIIFDYYRNGQSEFEAFRTGQSDIHSESDPVKWQQKYDFAAVKEGKILKIDYGHTRPVGMKALAFNTRRELFSDIRVRQALNHVFEFDRLNKTLFQSTHVRTESFFANTYFASTGVPQGKELALLVPYKDQLPPQLYKSEFHLSTASNASQSRENLKKAVLLLKEAGWNIEKGILVHQQTRKPFQFEILLYKADDEKVVLAFVRQLKHLGIDAKIRTVDSAQYENRMGHFDFDMSLCFWAHTFFPGAEQKHYWDSQEADRPFSRNLSGIKSPVIDDLCQKVVNADSYEDLKIAVHALDRVLLWGYYMIPLFHHNNIFLAHWNKFGHPDIDPIVGIYFTHWWSKEAEDHRK